MRNSEETLANVHTSEPMPTHLPVERADCTRVGDQLATRDAIVQRIEVQSV